MAKPTALASFASTRMEGAGERLRSQRAQAWVKAEERKRALTREHDGIAG